MFDVMVVKMDPFSPGTHAFGQHLFDGFREVAGPKEQKVITGNHTPCFGLIRICEPKGGKVMLACDACLQRGRTRKDRESFNAHWALTTIQVWIAANRTRMEALEGNKRYLELRQGIPVDMYYCKKEPLEGFTYSLLWPSWFEGGKCLAIPETMISSLDCGWAALELIASLRAMHAHSLGAISSALQVAIGDAHSAFGWLYPGPGTQS